MTIRAFVLGFALAMFIAAFTYFNDQVIGQTYLIGNHLPASVFGAGILLVMAVNPLLAWIGVRRMTAGEVAVVVALGLAVCGWPGSNLLRYFSGVTAKPTAIAPTKPLWQAQRTMSYVPGGSAQLADGFITDWPRFVAELRSAAASPGAAPPVLARIVEHMPYAQSRVLMDTPVGPGVRAEDRRAIVNGVNAALERADLLDDAALAGLRLPAAEGAIRDLPPGSRTVEEAVRLNRAALVATIPDLVRPPPAGTGLLLNGGRPHSAIDLLIAGDQAPKRHATPADVPWGVWWPTLRLWLGASLLLGIASLCLVVIVHPQWSQRELLPYPTVRFLEELAAPAKEGGRLPAIASKRVFWIGFLGVLAIHTLNGLQAWPWFQALPTISRQYDLWGLTTLFPNAATVYGSAGLWNPTIYFAVIGFGFLIPTHVSMSLGLSLVCWVTLGAFMATWGARLESEQQFTFGANGAAMRFGSYLGLTLMILYYGRRYYWGVVRGRLGLARGADVPPASVWAARLMAAALVGAVAVLVRWGGLDPLLASLMVAILMVIFLVLTRVNVETGLFYAQPDFLPGVLLIGFFGIGAVGPEAMIALILASVIFVADPREAVAPYLANALKMSHAIGGVRVGRAAAMLGTTLAIGLVVAVVATLTLQYDRGLNHHDDFSNQMLPEKVFNLVSSAVADLASFDELSESTGLGAADRLRRVEPMEGVVPWMAAGLALVLVCAAARIRWAAWPIHPVLFIVWGTYPAFHFAASFLLAAAVKSAIVRLGGVRTYHSVKPMMIGLIAGELLAVVGWSIVGTVYYAATGFPGAAYRIFPQ